jgi:bisphosphoglycerate-independent phosphoglycerate mutase (AlkP superfamily)
MRFRTLDDMQAGRAVFQDYTNEMLIKRGFPAERRTPEQAAEILASIVREHRFTLYEYFITDKTGHAQDMTTARIVLADLARLVRKLLSLLDLNRTTVLLTSDHGNIEDLSTRNHTLNPVPTLLWGEHREALATRVHNLADITPAIVEVLTSESQRTS